MKSDTRFCPRKKSMDERLGSMRCGSAVGEEKTFILEHFVEEVCMSMGTYLCSDVQNEVRAGESRASWRAGTD